MRRTIGAAATLLGIALRNVQLFAEVREHGLRDSLTGCFNRAHGLDSLETELTRARRTESTLSVIMFDVDQFKRINDDHGHLCGDEVLAAVGHRLRQVLRRSNLRCRFGGDEFLIVLPETPAAGAARVAEWVRGEIEQIVVVGRGAQITPTISVGVATATPGEKTDALIERADRSLYAAKAAGRNCVRGGSTRPGARLSVDRGSPVPIDPAVRDRIPGMSSAAPATARARNGLTLTQQIFIGLALGILVGWFVQQFHPELGVYFRPFSQFFLRMIKMIIAPLIFATLVAGIAGRRPLQVGRADGAQGDHLLRDRHDDRAGDRPASRSTSPGPATASTCRWARRRGHRQGADLGPDPPARRPRVGHRGDGRGRRAADRRLQHHLRHRARA